MKVLLDTSVLVAGLISHHEHESRAAVWLDAARRGRVRGAATTHALAETWATLTALPVEPRVAPPLAERMVDRLAEHLEVLELSQEDYRGAIQRCGDRGLRSGAVYDALHLVAGERWQADVVLTFNLQDFRRLAVEQGPRLTVPPDPPALDSV